MVRRRPQLNGVPKMTIPKLFQTEESRFSMLSRVSFIVYGDFVLGIWWNKYGGRNFFSVRRLGWPVVGGPVLRDETPETANGDCCPTLDSKTPRKFFLQSPASPRMTHPSDFCLHPSVSPPSVVITFRVMSRLTVAANRRSIGRAPPARGDSCIFRASPA